MPCTLSVGQEDCTTAQPRQWNPASQMSKLNRRRWDLAKVTELGSGSGGTLSPERGKGVETAASFPPGESLKPLEVKWMPEWRGFWEGWEGP